MKTDLSQIRTEYSLMELDADGLPKDPLDLFELWLEDAIVAEIKELTAMTLATVSEDGKPSARIVLLKNLDSRGFVFFTDYNSKKGKQIENNPNGAIVVYWKELERQVRVEGKIEKISDMESNDYFSSRPIESKIGTWISPQSQIIPNRQYLETLWSEFVDRNLDAIIQRPENWGGYRLKPDLIEFWQGRSNRLNDRIQYTRTGNGWRIERLAP